MNLSGMNFIEYGFFNAVSEKAGVDVFLPLIKVISYNIFKTNMTL